MPGTLTHSPAEIVRQLLVDLGVAGDYTSNNWPARATSEVDTPDNVVTVYDTAGVNRGRTMPDGEVQMLHGFQVRVRAATHALGWVKCYGIALSLDAVDDRTVRVGSTNYHVKSVVDRGDVLALGKSIEDSRRSLFTVNAMLNVRQLQ